MAFSWRDVSTGTDIESADFQEITNNLDSVDDNKCGSHNGEDYGTNYDNENDPHNEEDYGTNYDNEDDPHNSGHEDNGTYYSGEEDSYNDTNLSDLDDLSDLSDLSDRTDDSTFCDILA